LSEETGGLKEHKPEHDREFSIEVVTTADDVDARFNSEDPLRTVWDLALALVGGEGQPDQFRIQYRHTILGNLDRTLGSYAEEFDWGERVELELVPKPVVV
jgi:hypothetical protein